MPGVDEISKDPNYGAEAIGASKATIFTFVATFFASLYFLDDTVSLLSGAIFLIVGMFVVSILISAPFFFLKKRFPKGRLLFWLSDLLLTIFLTVMVFSYFFTNPMDVSTTSEPSDANPYVLKCDEPVPEFTLSGNSVPTKAQTDAVCACIWQEMSPWAKDVSVSIFEGKESEVSETQMRAFISQFGQRIGACNTENL